MSSGTRSVLAAVLLLAATPGVAQTDLAGTWRSEIRRGDQTSWFGVRFERSGSRWLTKVSLPGIDVWDLPMGRARFDGERVRLGAWELEYDTDRDALVGAVPAAFSAVHALPITLFRQEWRRPRPVQEEIPHVDPAWTRDLGSAVWAGVACEGDTVYVGTDGGEIFALSADDGEVRWRFETEGKIRARPTVAGAFLLVPSDDGNLYRLHRDSGKPSWTTRLGDPFSRIDPGQRGSTYNYYASSVRVREGILYLGTPQGGVFALEAGTGKVVWKIDAGSEVASTPAVTEAGVFVGTFGGAVIGLEAKSGKELWRHETGAPVVTSPVAVNGLVIAGSRSYDLLALKQSDGSPVWTHHFWFSWVESSPVLHGKRLLVGSSDAQVLTAFDPPSGNVLWSFDTGGSAWAQPAASDEAAFLGSVGVPGYMVAHRPGFFAVSLATGRPLWRSRPGKSPEGAALTGFASSPVVGKSKVFVAGLDGRVLAFDQEGPARK